MKRTRLQRPRSRIVRPRRAKTAAQKNERNDLIEWITNLKKVPCCICKRSFPTECLDFVHLPEYKKSFTISQFVRDSGHLPNARQLLEAEVAKCRVLCACCHRTVTKNRTKAGNKKVWWW